METVIDAVRKIVAKELSVPLERLTPETRLPELGIDSLGLVNIIFDLEEEFDIIIPYNANDPAQPEPGQPIPNGPDDFAQLETIGQIAAKVKQLVDAKATV